MQTRKEFASHSLTVHTPRTGTPVALGGITQLSSNSNTETTTDDSGRRYDLLRSIVSQAPVIQATTKAVQNALLAINVEGDSIDAGGLQTGVTATWEQKPNCSFDAGEVGPSDHLAHNVAQGLIKPDQLSASRGSDATLSLMVDALTPDGVNAPLSINSSASLPSPIDTSAYQVGAMRVGGILFDYTQSMELGFGVETGDKTPRLGEVWPDSVTIDKVRPEATFNSRQSSRYGGSAADEISLLGRTAEHVDTIVYFKKRLNRQTFFDNSENVHFSLTISGLIVPESVSSSNASVADVAFKLYGVSVDGSPPVILTPNIPYPDTFAA